MNTDQLKKFYTPHRKKWRKWLESHFEKEKEIWLIYPNKSSGKKRILYNDAVEEALCFGWIDSTVKKLDENNSMQRFTPRKPNTSYSQANKERMKWLFREKLIHTSSLADAERISKEQFIFPPDILNEIKKHDKAWTNYHNLSESYKRIRIAFIDAARKRPEEFNKRLSNFINKTKEGKLIKGFGGIEKYY